MAIVWSDVLAIAPELTSVATSTYQAILTIADRQVDDGVWGEFGNDGRRYLSAHLATLANGKPGGIVGTISAETLGPMSRSYVLPPGISGALGTTKYGAEYERLLLIAVALPAFVP